MERLNYFKHELKNFLKERNKSFNENALLSSVHKAGVAIIEDFWSEEECAQVRNVIDEKMETYQHQAWVSDDGADMRLFGAELLDSSLKAFWEDESLKALALDYEGREGHTGFVMANRIKAAANNAGSGGGWHRDSAANHQFKAILYLTDVTEESGPFSYVVGSHKAQNVVVAEMKYNFTPHQNRFSEEELSPLLAKAEVKRITGKAGTLILADTRGIHRGTPIQRGSRYALTNYYLPHINDHFKQLLVQV